MLNRKVTELKGNFMMSTLNTNDTKLKKDVTLRYLTRYDKLPSYMVHNKYLIKGYRIGGTHLECFKSLFKLHNETFNAWTMVISCSYAIFSTLWLFNNYSLNNDDILVFLGSLIANLLHFPFSFCYHMFMPISTRVANYWRTLDCIFIFVRLGLAGLSISYYILPTIQFYIISTILLIFCAWNINECRYLKAAIPLNRLKQVLMISMIVCCYLYSLLTLILKDIGTNEVFYGTISLLAFIISGGMYLFQFPERLFPGKCDTFYSHTLMHVGYIIICICEFMVLFSIFKQRMASY